jgi:hypothetical protein
MVKCRLGKCHHGKISFGQMSMGKCLFADVVWANVVWANFMEPTVTVYKMTSLGRVLGFFVYIVLFIFFASRVVTSWQRLQEKQVGTRVKRINANQVLYPSLTVCQYDKIAHDTEVWFSEGYDRPLPENDIFKELTYWEAHNG